MAHALKQRASRDGQEVDCGTAGQWAVTSGRRALPEACGQAEGGGRSSVAELTAAERNRPREG